MDHKIYIIKVTLGLVLVDNDCEKNYFLLKLGNSKSFE